MFFRTAFFVFALFAGASLWAKPGAVQSCLENNCVDWHAADTHFKVGGELQRRTRVAGVGCGDSRGVALGFVLWEAWRTFLVQERQVVHCREFAELDADGVWDTEPEFSSEAVELGRSLSGTGGRNCISCHKMSGHDSLGPQGMDLALQHQRLRPGWFRDWLLKPTELRKNTRMPSLWLSGTEQHYEPHSNERNALNKEKQYFANCLKVQNTIWVNIFFAHVD